MSGMAKAALLPPRELPTALSWPDALFPLVPVWRFRPFIWKNVDIPPGVDSNVVFQMDGYGHIPTRDAVPGTLRVHINCATRGI